MDHLRGEQANPGTVGRGFEAGQGFTATLELAELEPLLTLIRCIGCDAELRVHAAEGGDGQLLYAAGELASGSFDGLSGPPAVERMRALRGGAIELAVVRRASRAAPPARARAAPDANAADEQDVPAPELPATPELQPLLEHMAQAYPHPSGAFRMPPFAAVLHGAGLGPVASERSPASSPLRRWLWALAPALAIGLWIAAEIAERLRR